MQQSEQIPFVPPSLVENPEPRCPCLLLLDTSTSMAGAPIAELNAGIRAFKQQLAADAMAALRIEIALMTFGPVRLVSDFQTPDVFDPPTLVAQGDTPLGEAIIQGLALLEERKNTYKQAGIAYYRPWVFLITDGAPTDGWTLAAERVRQGDSAERRAFSFFAVGVEGANMETLAQISSPQRTPLMLKGLSFRELFFWLSSSLGGVARSQPGERISLPAPTGWAAL